MRVKKICLCGKLAAKGQRPGLYNIAPCWSFMLGAPEVQFLVAQVAKLILLFYKHLLSMEGKLLSVK